VIRCLYQPLFSGFYSHPAVYVIILPVFGVFLEAGRSMPASLSSASLCGDGLVGEWREAWCVWCHHMFPSACPSGMRDLFMVTTI